MGKKGLFDTFDPITTQSTNYKNWKAILDLKTCIECHSIHGQVYSMNEVVDPAPPLHNNCRCDIISMESIEADINYYEGRRNRHRVLWLMTD